MDKRIPEYWKKIKRHAEQLAHNMYELGAIMLKFRKEDEDIE